MGQKQGRDRRRDRSCQALSQGCPSTDGQGPEFSAALIVSHVTMQRRQMGHERLPITSSSTDCSCRVELRLLGELPMNRCAESKTQPVEPTGLRNKDDRRRYREARWPVKELLLN